MAVLDFPDTTSFRSSIFGFEDNVGIVSSQFTGQIQTVEFSGAIWKASYTLKPMHADSELARSWRAWLGALSGRSGRFYGYDPSYSGANGVATGTPRVNGSGQSGKVLATDGWTVSVTGILKRGDYIEVNKELKVVTDDVDSNALGEADIPIFPPLKASPTDDSLIEIANPKCLMMLDAGNIQWQASEDKFLSVQFTAREAFDFTVGLIDQNGDSLVDENGFRVTT